LIHRSDVIVVDLSFPNLSSPNSSNFSRIEGFSVLFSAVCSSRGRTDSWSSSPNWSTPSQRALRPTSARSRAAGPPPQHHHAPTSSAPPAHPTTPPPVAPAAPAQAAPRPSYRRLSCSWLEPTTASILAQATRPLSAALLATLGWAHRRPFRIAPPFRTYKLAGQFPFIRMQQFTWPRARSYSC
jgi:hypothetical protein